MDRVHVNTIVIGHVDSGKSTVTGHLLYDCGRINQQTLREMENGSAAIGKGSFKFAWVTDKTKLERERGITMVLTHLALETEKFSYTIINGPGHRDYIRNMITGITQADVGLLVVAANSEFVWGMDKYGQTREHAILSYTLGVKQLIVVVNKMDAIESAPYSQDRFLGVKSEVQKCLSKIGYDIKRVQFIPTSGWTGENLVTKSDRMPWWTGPTLLEAFDSIDAPKRPVDKPLRFPIQDVYKIVGVGTVIVGRVETGMLRPGMNVIFAPDGRTAEIKSIEKHYQTVDQAIPGDIVGVNVRNVDVFLYKQIKRGYVVGDSLEDPPVIVEQFTAQLIVLNHPGEIRAGYTPILHCHTARIPCKWKTIKQKIDRRSGKVLEEMPQCVRSGEAAIVEMVPTKPLCVEAYSEYASLGRFVVRDISRIVAVGVIKSTQRKFKEGKMTKGVQSSY